MSENLTKEEIIKLALQAGFDEWNEGCLNGNSEDDRLVSIQEYPCGEAVLKLAALILETESQRMKIATAILSGLVNIDIFKNCMTYEDSELQVTNAVAMAYRFADALIDKEQNPLAPRWVGEKAA